MALARPGQARFCVACLTAGATFSTLAVFAPPPWSARQAVSHSVARWLSAGGPARAAPGGAAIIAQMKITTSGAAALSAGPGQQRQQAAADQSPPQSLRRPAEGSSIIYGRPGAVVLAADRCPAGMVIVHAPADALHPVHRHGAAPETDARTRKRHVPQMRRNLDPGASGGRGPAHARLGHRPHRAAAAAAGHAPRRNRPRARPASPSPHGPIDP
jgi:hypothetical protein